jgi:hypothetical protein
MPGSVHLAEGQERPCRIEGGVIRPVHRASERPIREELRRFGQSFPRLRQTVTGQRRDLRLHRAAPSVSSARMKGVCRQTGSSRMRRPMTRGEM